MNEPYQEGWQGGKHGQKGRGMAGQDAQVSDLVERQ